MTTKLLNGKVKNCEEKQAPNYYFIEGDDGQEYFAHIGDLEFYEEMIYPYRDAYNVENMKEGEQVSFKVNNNRPHAFNVKKIILNNKLDIACFIVE